MATSQILHTPGTTRTFAGSGGDTTFTPKNISGGAGRVSAQWDRGSGAQPGLYRWFAKTKSGSTYTIGRAVQIYLGQAKDATDIPGRLGTTDAALAATDNVRNLTYAGQIVADITTSSTALVSSGLVFIYARYVTVVWLNDLGVTLTNTDGDHELILQPLPPETQ